MPFSKFSNLDAKHVIHFKLCHQRDERLNCNLQQTNFRRQSFLDGFYASENQNKRKVKTESKTHQGKITMRCKFLQDIYIEYYLFLELAGSNLAQSLLKPFKVILHRLFLLIVPVVFVNAERCSVKNRVVFIKQ